MRRIFFSFSFIFLFSPYPLFVSCRLGSRTTFACVVPVPMLPFTFPLSCFSFFMPLQCAYICSAFPLHIYSLYVRLSPITRSCHGACHRFFMSFSCFCLNRLLFYLVVHLGVGDLFSFRASPAAPRPRGKKQEGGPPSRVLFFSGTPSTTIVLCLLAGVGPPSSGLSSRPGTSHFPVVTTLTRLLRAKKKQTPFLPHETAHPTW